VAALQHEYSLHAHLRVRDAGSHTKRWCGTSRSHVARASSSSGSWKYRQPPSSPLRRSTAGPSGGGGESNVTIALRDGWRAHGARPSARPTVRLCSSVLLLTLSGSKACSSQVPVVLFHSSRRGPRPRARSLLRSFAAFSSTARSRSSRRRCCLVVTARSRKLSMRHRVWRRSLINELRSRTVAPDVSSGRVHPTRRRITAVPGRRSMNRLYVEGTARLSRGGASTEACSGRMVTPGMIVDVRLGKDLCKEATQPAAGERWSTWRATRHTCDVECFLFFFYDLFFSFAR
jgi:hypothetical protein